MDGPGHRSADCESRSVSRENQNRKQKVESMIKLSARCVGSDQELAAAELNEL